MKYATLLFLLVPFALRGAEKEIETKKSAEQREKKLDALHQQIMTISKELLSHEASLPDALQEDASNLKLVTHEIVARAKQSALAQKQEEYDSL